MVLPAFRWLWTGAASVALLAVGSAAQAQGPEVVPEPDPGAAPEDAQAEPEALPVELEEAPPVAPVRVRGGAGERARAGDAGRPRASRMKAAFRGPHRPAAPVPAEAERFPKGRFSFGSYGRVVAAGDLRGSRGRDADIVAYGTRIDESTYGELELTREDEWEPGIRTRMVSTLALGDPIFHQDGRFDAAIALRNFYVEEQGIIDPGLSAWVGSRMYRGDDIYLLDFWPLDNLNTVGGGVKFRFNSELTSVAWHVGLNLVDDPFQRQIVERPAAQNQPGTTQVAVLDRPRTITSLKLSHTVPFGARAGFKAALYGEVHGLPSGQREDDIGIREDVPGDSGSVVGAQLGAYTGERDTFANLFFRYSSGLAAYGEFSTPSGTSAERDSSGAREFLVGFSGNWEKAWFSLIAGGYFRSFRDASPEQFRFENLDEGIFVLRPHVFFGKHGGLAVEGSYQAQQRAVLSTATNEPLSGSLWRLGFIPFLSPAGRGSFARPQLRVIYVISARDAGARSLYPKGDPFALRQTEQFIGVGAEWWFNSTSYGQ